MVRPDGVLPRTQPIRFKIIICRFGIVLRVAGAGSTVELRLYACVEGVLRFLFRQKLSASVFSRTFEGRNAEARPKSPQGRLGVGEAGDGPLLGARPAR